VGLVNQLGLKLTSSRYIAGVESAYVICIGPVTVFKFTVK